MLIFRVQRAIFSSSFSNLRSTLLVSKEPPAVSLNGMSYAYGERLPKIRPTPAHDEQRPQLRDLRVLRAKPRLAQDAMSTGPFVFYSRVRSTQWSSGSQASLSFIKVFPGT